MITDHAVDAVYGGKGFRVDLRGAARDDDGGVGIISFGLADLAAAFSDGFVGDRTGVDNHSIAQARILGMTRHDVTLIGVQATAKRDDFRTVFIIDFGRKGHAPLDGRLNPIGQGIWTEGDEGLAANRFRFTEGRRHALE